MTVFSKHDHSLPPDDATSDDADQTTYPSSHDHSIQDHSTQDHSTLDASSNRDIQPGSREEHLEDRIHQVLEQKLISLLDNESTNREITWLRRQVRWAFGFLIILIIILGGAFTWFAYLMRTNPDPQASQDTASSAAIAPLDAEDAERLEAIETQLQTLGDRIPENLSATLTTNKEQLESLSEQVSALSDDMAKNQQTLTTLETTLQSLEDSLLPKENGTDEPENTPN